MKRSIIAVMAVVGLFVGVAMFMPEIAAAAPKDEVCQGVGAVSSGGCNGTTNGITNVVKTFIRIFSSIIGLAGVIMLMVAGFKYTTAGGDPGKVGEAKKTIIYAIIGLVVAASAQSIVWFVLDRSTETEAERKKREAAQQKATLLPTSGYYTIEFNNKTVV